MPNGFFDSWFIINAINQLAYFILQVIDVSLGINLRALDSAIDTIVGKVDLQLDVVQSAINISQDAILIQIDNSSDGIRALQKSTTQAIIDSISDDTDAVIEGQERIAVSIGTSLDRQTDIITEVIAAISNDVTVVVENEITIDASLITTVTEQIAEIVANEAATNQSLVEAVLEIAKTFGMELQTDITKGSKLLQKELIDIVKAILKNAGEITNGVDLQKIIAEGTFIPDIFKHLFDVLSEPLRIGADELGQQMQRLRQLDFASVGVLCDPLPENNEWVPDNPFFNAFINGIMLMLQAVMVPLALATQRGQICLQNDALSIPWNLLQPGDAIEALHRKIIDRDATVMELQRGGFSRDQANVLIATGDTIPQIEFLFSMWFREVITDAALDGELRSLGFTDPRIKALKEIAFFIPPVQDIITMAVREVFSPEISVPNGQFEEFPADFGKFAKMQGVTEAWAINYWAAHWVLPSIQMGYEMFHRQIIDQGELEGLMKALDVMPVWRSRLVAMSFTPFTRVDIRRMHALEVLDDAQVETAYRNIGYSPENAQLQLDFVKRLNEDDDLLTLDIASDLTRGNVITFYVRGIIPRSVAYGLLLQMGINVLAAELFLQNADFTLELRERRDEIDLVLDTFKVEETTFVEAADALNGIGLETKELAQAQLDLERMRISKVKTPSKADLDKFLKADLIPPEVYTGMLERQGYNPMWSDLFLQLHAGAG